MDIHDEDYDVQALSGILTEKLEDFVKNYHHITCELTIEPLDSNITVAFDINTELEYEDSIARLNPVGPVAKAFFNLGDFNYMFEDYSLERALKNANITSIPHVIKEVLRFKKLAQNYLDRISTVTDNLGLEIDLNPDRNALTYKKIHYSELIHPRVKFILPKELTRYLNKSISESESKRSNSAVKVVRKNKYIE